MLAICVFSIQAEDRRALHVLLIGNGLGSYWNMTGSMSSIARSIPSAALLDIEVSFSGRADNLKAQISDRYGAQGVAAIRKGTWDVVVLQENPYEPLMRREAFFSSVGQLAGEARKVGSSVILFEPFALAPGSVVYGSETEWAGGNARIMQERLHEASNALGSAQHLRVARVGDAFEWVQQNDPRISLYENDKMHPSPCGAFLEACVIVSMLTGKDTRQSHWLPPMGVSEAEAGILRAVPALAGLSN